MSPTQRTLKACREMGRTCVITERWNPFAKIRQDLFGFIDVVCLSDNEIIGVQATSADNHSHRVVKIQGLDTYPKWLKAGGKVEVWSWGKKKIKRGGKAVRWEARIEKL